MSDVDLTLTPDQRVRVFVSSTFNELASERAAARRVIDRLGMEPMMFDLGARPVPPKELYRWYLERSQIFVGIYWERYGWVGPAEEVSGLEDEYLRSSHLLHLLYVKKPAPARDPRLTAMVQRFLADGMATYMAFSTVDELERLLFDDLKWVLTHMGSKLLPNTTSVAGEPSVGREISEEQPEFSEPISPATTEAPPDEMGKVHNHTSHGIFLSYRREDSAPYARLLQRELKERFPTTQVFLDLDSIEAGLNFAEVIQDALSSSAVLVALIGHRWTTIVDEDGRRRLDNPDDYVRYEIQTALERGLRVIPVLVDDAKVLRRQDLPSQLQSLTRLNALELSYGRYQHDADRLLGVIERVLAAGPSSE